ncbi:MAG: hypothetical protein OXD54_00660 [Candidatus Poribacteria bacterium]|nr:hypothetical protein [Candidatus Poribacteria bacterium]
MIRKYWLFHIILGALVCVQFVCPLFCVAFEQTVCNSMSTEKQPGSTEFGSSCCNNTRTNTTDKSKTPSEKDNSCCVSDLDVILPSDTFNANSVNDFAEQRLVTIVPISSTQPVAQEQLLHFTLPPKLVISSLNRNLSRRGPPNTRS